MSLETSIDFFHIWKAFTLFHDYMRLDESSWGSGSPGNEAKSKIKPIGAGTLEP